jgi:ATP-dependent Clp protease protease subunit
MNQDFNKFRKSLGISGTVLHDYQKLTNIYAGYINPTIIEERQLNVASMDVFSRLMMDRIIFLGTAIDDTVANVITGQLLYLQSQDSSSPIDLYINSPGGSVYSGYSIYDTMHLIEPDVNTIVCGMAASMAYILTIAGDKRSALRHSRLMQHQPLGGISGQASDIQITAKQIQKVKDELNSIISDKTGQPIEKVEVDTDRDYWMDAIEAKEYGAIDKVIGLEK